MNKMKKALVLFLCAVLLVVGSVMGTLAYLTAQDTVVNTFTVGDVQITLDEAKVDEYGNPIVGADRVKENEYHLLPGHTYTKDPTVTVLAGSEESYVRMLVTVKNLHKLKAAMPKSDFPELYNGEVFLLQNVVSGWDPQVWVFENVNANVYEFRYYKTVATVDEKGEDTTDAKLDALFDTLTIPGKVNNEQLAELAHVEIVVTAEAIQADGFANDDAAWNAFETQHP